MTAVLAINSYITKHIIHAVKAGWARDIPAAAHGAEKEPVVTAPTPGHLLAMAHLEKLGSLESAARSADSDIPTSPSALLTSDIPTSQSAPWQITVREWGLSPQALSPPHVLQR